MSKSKYQIFEKAQYLNILLLKDEIQSSHELLLKTITDTESWLTKLRTTRNIFLSLNNIIDIMKRVNLSTPPEHVELSRSLKKKLTFANHFRNRAVGHLDQTLLEREVQWSPQLFYISSKENEEYKILEANRIFIEAGINSFINQEGMQKIFNTKIDLMYPPDAKLFFNHLQELVEESIQWLSSSAELILSTIKHHEEKEIQELAAVAALTSFNLKAESKYDYPLDEQEAQLSRVIQELEKIDVDKEVIKFLKEKFKI